MHTKQILAIFFREETFLKIQVNQRNGHSVTFNAEQIDIVIHAYSWSSGLCLNLVRTTWRTDMANDSYNETVVIVSGIKIDHVLLRKGMEEFGRQVHCMGVLLFLFTHKRTDQNSPSLPFGFSAAAAKQRGQDALKSTLWCGTPFLKRTEGSLLVKFSLAFLAAATEK